VIVVTLYIYIDSIHMCVYMGMYTYAYMSMYAMYDVHTFVALKYTYFRRILSSTVESLLISSHKLKARVTVNIYLKWEEKETVCLF
jgi:hypothetical protein